MHTGEYPIIGVNTFLSSKGSPTILPKELIPACAEAPAGRRATEEEKEAQIRTVENVQQAYAEEGKAALRKLQEVAIRNENMFAVLMEATVCAPSLRKHFAEATVSQSRCTAGFKNYEGKPLTFPVKAAGPKAEYLKYHRSAVFGK
jgi:methylmalonyl-CoA mutase N-terminal domain/subunit